MFSRVVARTLRQPLRTKESLSAISNPSPHLSSRLQLVENLTTTWGTAEHVGLYLDKCQVDTPNSVIELTWQQVLERRTVVGKVVDFGAGDGRFSIGGKYSKYIGYEIDTSRARGKSLPAGAQIKPVCAFSEEISDADVCLGNPPYVRNQDLPRGWRERAAKTIEQRGGVRISGLANAWQYFFMLSLLSTGPRGLVALVIPYEWVSRPSAKAIRDYIHEQRWAVSVYRLSDATFERVLTTSSLTIVDKTSLTGTWEFFSQRKHGFEGCGISGRSQKVLAYSKRDRKSGQTFASRGLSPGSQRIFTLTESERVRLGLKVGEDVVPCVTTLRHLPTAVASLTERSFKKHYVHARQKCWLVNTSRRTLSTRLTQYLEAVPEVQYQNWTCLSRNEWWRFRMPPVPDILVASGFRNDHTKVVRNEFGARAVGGVYGIYNVPSGDRSRITRQLRETRLGGRVVPHSNGFHKIEVAQVNTILKSLSKGRFRNK